MRNDERDLDLIVCSPCDPEDSLGVSLGGAVLSLR